MLDERTIDSRDLSVEQVFKDHYVVPDFQREYVWKEDNVRELFVDFVEDVFDERRSLISGQEYFIGSIVVCKGDDGRFQLIDGQQRLTTLFLFLCAIRDAIGSAGKEEPRTLQGMISAERADERGRETREYRLVLQYEDSKGFLTKIAEEGGARPSSAETESMVNLRVAYDTLKDEIDGWCKGNDEDMRALYGALIRRVKLIRVETPSLGRALKVFETINDRGVGLDAMDLLKNLLFMHAKSTDHIKLKADWKLLTEVLSSVKEKPLRFLRYQIMANYEDYKAEGGGKPIREDDIYRWITERVEPLAIKEDPLGYLNLLVGNAKDYARFATKKSTDGLVNRYLENIELLSNKARQHFILLLAARHLPGDAFRELTRVIENLFFAYLIAREPTRVFEPRFGEWAIELRKCKTLDDVKAFAAQRIDLELSKLSARFDLAIDELAEGEIQKYRLRYILAKLSQHVEEGAFHQDRPLVSYMVPNIDVEHILPQNPTQAAIYEFGAGEQWRKYVHRLGNLALLERPINASVSNDAFSKKIDGYKQSQMLLTKAIVEVPTMGGNTAIDRTFREFKAFDKWSADNVEQRQTMLKQLAREVWGISSASVAAS